MALLRRIGITRFILLIIFFFSILITGCSGNGQNDTEATELPTPIPTPIPTTAPDRAVLIISSNTSEVIEADASALISELAASSGLEFEIREQIFANELTSDVKVAVFLEQPDNLGSFAASASGTQFIAISDQEWNPSGNVTIIRKNEDHATFLSGYLAAMIAPDFRVGGLLASEQTMTNQAFLNGVQYFCGLCAAVVYPLNTYPVVSQMPSASTVEAWQNAFNEVNTNKVNVLYLASEALVPAFGNYLSSQRSLSLERSRHRKNFFPIGWRPSALMGYLQFVKFGMMSSPDQVVG